MKPDDLTIPEIESLLGYFEGVDASGFMPVRALRQLLAVMRERDKLADALEKIESGDLPDGSLASPNAQLFAAEVLAALERGDLRKP